MHVSEENGMGEQERRRRGIELRREDIVDAAERVFFAKGFEHASMDEVAKEAEFSKRTLYVYFSSKEQIYFEIMIRGYRLLLGMLDEQFRERAPQSAAEELHGIFFTLFDFSQQYPDYFKAIMEYETTDPDVRTGVEDASKAECYRLGEQLFGRLAGALARGEENGELRKGLGGENAALILWACAVGVFNTGAKKGGYLHEYHNTEPRDFVAGAFEWLLRLITRRGGEKR